MFSVLSISNYKYFIAKSCARRISSNIQVETLGNVKTIGLNIPDNKNRLDEVTYNELCDTLKAFDNDDAISACALYGIGGSFCTGCSENFIPDPYKLVNSTSKPLIAGITGYATDFGFELSLLCDFRVMENTALIGFNSYPKTFSTLFSQRLVDCVGLSVALDLCLTARNFSAKEAFQYGLVQRIVDCGTGVGQAVQLAKTVGKFPTPILRKAKEAVYSSLQSSQKIS